MKSNRSIGIWVISAIAIIFGLLTLKAGGSVLFVDGISRQEAGHYIPFILWFNFIMGFVYIIAGVSLWLQKSWSVKLSGFIAGCTIVAFAILGVMILQGIAFEQRTVGAMLMRSVVWLLISLVAYKKITQRT